MISYTGETKNVSSGGVLLTDTSEPIEIGQPIEYLISLPTGRKVGEVRLRCVGKVVRRDEDNNLVAVTLERYEFVRMAGAGRF